MSLVVGLWRDGALTGVGFGNTYRRKVTDVDDGRRRGEEYPQFPDDALSWPLDNMTERRGGWKSHSAGRRKSAPA